MERIPVIKTSDLSIGYILKGGQKKRVHDALDLNLYPGEVTCLLGLNGAGKSTTSSGRRNRANGEAAEFLFTR